MKISQIIEKVDYIEIFGDTNLECKDIHFDSRKVAKGSIFIAIKGHDSDGHEYISEAISQGAICIVYQDSTLTEILKKMNIAGLLTQNTRRALSIISSNFYDHPSTKINLIGVTGTNGKTTIATLLYNLFTSLGYGCGLLSTIENYVINEVHPTINTTSDPISINYLLNRMVERGCEYCFMEISSHSLHQDRVSSLKFKGGIFTNLTHDHLEYHKTFAEYIRCKKMLFDILPKGSFALTNNDDKNGSIVVQSTKAKVYTYSSRTLADFKVKTLEKSIEGSLLSIDGNEVWSRFIGEYNAHNIIAIYGAAILLGAEKTDTLKGISNLKSVPGRLEYVQGGNNITAVIDYAHTPDALENVLKTLKGIAKDDKLIAVFGCGGDRDKTKRSEMAKIGARYADRVIITSDNPRSEKPEDIVEDMKQGLDIAAKAKTLSIIDRKEAIRTSLLLAEPGSIVLIAGKGHENYQIINGEKTHFNDKEIVQEIFSQNT